jgi:hypothetical protein
MKKETKTIDVVCAGWRNGNELCVTPKDLTLSEITDLVKGAKLKLIIELPEKKVEITESEFDKAYDEAGGYTISREILKQKLFGKK